MSLLQVPAVLAEHSVHQQIAGSPGAFHSRLERESELRHELLRDCVGLLDAGGYALHSKLLERIEEHEPQKLTIDALAIDRNGCRYLAAIEVTIYHPCMYFVISSKAYCSEFVGFPFTARPFCDEFGDSRPVFRLPEDSHTPPLPGSYKWSVACHLISSPFDATLIRVATQDPKPETPIQFFTV